MDVKEFFGKYAKQYANSDSHAKGVDLEILINLLNVDGSKTALDLATGTGFTAVALASKAKHVTGLDKTEEMLEEAKKYAAADGIGNISFMVADVEELPFGGGTTDIVTCRRAAHHFPDKTKFLAEAMRVLKPGGLLGISDMASPENDTSDGFNTLERIRDPSHAGAKSVSSWKKLLAESGFEALEVVEWDDRVPFDKWLYPVPIDSEEGKECFRFLIESTPEFKKLIGFMEENNSFIKKRVVISARKPE